MKRWQLLLALVAPVVLGLTSNVAPTTITFTIDDVSRDVPSFENDEGLFVIGREVNRPGL